MSEYNLNARINLALSESDERSFETNKILNEINSKVCVNRYMVLKHLLSSDEKYFLLKDELKRDVVIQSKQGIAFFLKCIEIHSILVNNTNTICFYIFG